MPEDNPAAGGTAGEFPSYDHEVVVAAGDIDVNNHANNVVYVRWVQEAAIAHWEHIAPRDIVEGNFWVVVRHEIDYRRPAKLGERLLVRTWVETMTAIKSERHCSITRAADGVEIARVKTVWCTIDPASGRPRRMDARIPALFGLEAK
ncbi:MAG: acyl-CoA thioesterase [Puniceicoccales bacterium]|jgi:acyl-CoA thioester hydrolase|nr:acyl-CoA thioesterase [Puniceicoccales bacterium]